MRRDELNQRLSRITTIWPVLRQAQAGGDEAGRAQRELMERYGAAVRRYLLAALRDEHAADELTQEFALALVRGEFRGADPERGRFRSYLKTALFRMVGKYRRRERRHPRPAAGDAAAAPPEESGRAFDEQWRAELLGRTWAALAEAQPTFHAVLRFRAEHPDMPSHEMAPRLTERLGKPMTADGVRQTLRRARDRFAELLLEEVARSLERPTPELVEEELGELGLLEYCKEALGRQA